MKNFVLFTTKSYGVTGEPINTRILLRSNNIVAVKENKYGTIVEYSIEGGKNSSIVVNENFDKILNGLKNK